MVLIANENNDFFCGMVKKNPVYLNSRTLARKFATGAEARKVLFHLKEKTNNDNLKIIIE